jgi:hypothetical protein
VTTASTQVPFTVHGAESWLLLNSGKQWELLRPAAFWDAFSLEQKNYLVAHGS